MHAEQGIDLDGVMKAVMRLTYQHEVAVDSCYASLVVSICVIVGFAKALDPHLNLMEAALPCLLAYSLMGEVMGRLYGCVKWGLVHDWGRDGEGL